MLMILKTIQGPQSSEHGDTWLVVVVVRVLVMVVDDNKLTGFQGTQVIQGQLH